MPTAGIAPHVRFRVRAATTVLTAIVAINAIAITLVAYLEIQP